MAFAEKSPACPVCGLRLFDSQARWATLQDVRELGWQDCCIIDAAKSSTTSDDLLEPDDVATDLDSPAPIDFHLNEVTHDRLSPAEQLDDVVPQLDVPDESAEPKPGC